MRLRLGIILRKELTEQIRTHRLTVIVAVFVLFGLISPLTAKMLPEIIKMVGGESFVLQIPTPTPLDAIDQYLKNFAQMGMLAIILVAMGAVANEQDRGTAAMVLCKPVSRAAFIAGKYLAYSLVALGSLLLAAVACYYYVAILWTPYDLLAFLGTNALLGLYLLVILSLTLLCSALFRRSLAAGGLAFGLFFLASIVGGLPKVGEYAPGTLLVWSRALIAGSAQTAWPALFVSLGIVVGCGLLSWLAFRNREL